MRKEYDIKNLNPRRNPYLNLDKIDVILSLDEKVLEYMKKEAKNLGIPYQALINLYLRDCVINDRKIEVTWK